MGKRRAVLLDRDGVINDHALDYVTSWEQFRLMPDALEALRRLHQAGWLVLVATNQSAVGRGMMTEAELEGIHSRMLALVEQGGGRIERVFCCPHGPDEGCSCRKPKPGLLLEAARECDLDLASCYLVGDSARDIAAGQAVGSTTILVEGVDASRAREQLQRLERPPGFLVKNLAAAVDVILRLESDQSSASTRSG